MRRSMAFITATDRGQLKLSRTLINCSFEAIIFLVLRYQMGNRRILISFAMKDIQELISLNRWKFRVMFQRVSE